MINAQNIWWDADTKLEEVVGNMPKDIQALYEDPAVITENDTEEYWKPAGEELPEEFDWDAQDWNEYIQNWRDSRCCPTATYAASVLCGCGGSGQMPTDIRAYLERQSWEMNR